MKQSVGTASRVATVRPGRWHRVIPVRWTLLAATVLVTCGSADGQPVRFGAADDPSEKVDLRLWSDDNTVDVLAGFSLIGPTWRSATSVTAGFSTPNLTARLQSTFRTGLDGSYGPDFDESYDVLRQIDFVRFKLQSRNALYARVGAIPRVRLGTGHLVNFFNSTVAWDERTIGAEFSWQARVVELSAFTDNVVIDGVSGGRLAIRPLQWSDDARARTLTLGVNYVTDVSGSADFRRPVLAGYNVDISFVAAFVGEAALRPFASVAVIDGGGGGMGIGADFMSDNFVDVARFNLRLALYYNSRGFRPGYVGSFYQVENPKARIRRSEDFENPTQLVGIALPDSEPGNDLETELRFLIFDRFELWYNFRRHFGLQSLSEYHLRLFFRTDKLRAQFGQDRAGLRGFFTLFNDLGDQTALVFQTDYNFRKKLWLVVRSRYTYQRRDAEDGMERYLVQRRFEPLFGLRVRF
ncbi:MAG: hypothetical protein R2832_05365 [Rhodothermales bacterium]